MAKNIAIDRAKRLHEEAHKGHNRWHPDISPVIEAEPMEEVAIETRDASDGQIRPGMHAEDVAKIDLGAVHASSSRERSPAICSRSSISTSCRRGMRGRASRPGGGFLPHLFPHHFVVHWDLTPAYA